MRHLASASITTAPMNRPWASVRGGRDAAPSEDQRTNREDRGESLIIRRRHPHLITANCDQHARSRGVHPNVESENVVSGMFCDANYLGKTAGLGLADQ
jgi:hypothetical protein